MLHQGNVYQLEASKIEPLKEVIAKHNSGGTIDLIYERDIVGIKSL